MKTVLLTTNLSSNSRSVIDYAISFFGTDIDYVLLHGYTIDYAQTKRKSEDHESGSVKPEMIADEETLEKLGLEKLYFEKKFKKLKLRCSVKRGIGITAIESICNQLKPDLVVIGTHPFTNEANTNRVSVATRLIGSLDIPLLVVPYGMQFLPLQKVLYAYDKIEFDSSSMDVLSYLFQKHKARLTFLHIIEKEDVQTESNLLDGIGKLLAVKKIEKVSKQSQDPVSAILSYVDEFEFKLFIVTARKESYMQNFWTGSKVDSMATHLKQPMLVLTD